MTAAVQEDIYATRRLVDKHGFSPLLEPGEFCIVSGLLHCCTPDGTLFAVQGRGKYTSWAMERGKMSIIGNPPSHAWAKDKKTKGIVENCWTIINGKWTKSLAS